MKEPDLIKWRITTIKWFSFGLRKWGRKLSDENRLQREIIDYGIDTYNVHPIVSVAETNKNEVWRWFCAYTGLRSGDPDMFFPYPRKGYHGLFIELKTEKVKVFKKNGDLYSNDHIKKQYERLKLYESRGYKSVFALGKLHAKSIIDGYFE